jgi:hypothetical protein
MLEKLLRARLPEQIVALIENLEQNPDASHLHKVLEFASLYGPDITKFERFMLGRAVRRVRKLVKRDELLRKAMEIVINKPEEKTKTYQYDPNTFIATTGRSLLAQQMMDNTVSDPRKVYTSNLF